MKVQNEMATKITLDTIEAASSLKSFTSGISALTNGWKASEAAHKAVGDSLGALKAKFDGIGNVIEVQKQKIEELKNRQEGLDRTNKSQAETWLKLEKDIQTATRQLTSYEAQQEKAKSSMEYYTSGLADLQKGYRNTQALSKSYAERLQAEGKALDAKKVQLSGVKNSLTNLSKQYQLQEKELQSIAEKSGMTSEAYMKQQIRLNETATAMAKAKSSIGQLNAEMKVLNPGVFTRMKNKANELNGRMGKLKESVLSFKGLVGVNLISNAVTSGFTLLTSQMKGIITNFPNKLASLAVGWVKKLFEDFGAGGDGNSPAGRMAKSEFAKIAKHAARLMHQKLSERDIEHLYYQASTESSVDPAQNGGYDDHDGTGLPIGLFQYKLGTWRSWAVPGHANIHSALDQIMAVLNDSNWRNDFPPIGVKRGWGPSGHRMMAYGGRIDTNQLIEVAENNKPEYIIPTDPAKRPRAWQLMHELTSEFTNQEPQRINVSDNRDLKELNDKFDSLLAMFSQLLGLNNQQIKAIRESGFDKIKQYQQQALDQRLADYQGY